MKIEQKIEQIRRLLDAGAITPAEARAVLDIPLAQTVPPPAPRTEADVIRGWYQEANGPKRGFKGKIVVSPPVDLKAEAADAVAQAEAAFGDEPPTR